MFVIIRYSCICIIFYIIFFISHWILFYIIFFSIIINFTTTFLAVVFSIVFTNSVSITILWRVWIITPLRDCAKFPTAKWYSKGSFKGFLLQQIPLSQMHHVAPWQSYKELELSCYCLHLILSDIDLHNLKWNWKHSYW